MSWNTLPLYRKIQIEGPKLTVAHANYLNKIQIKEKLGAEGVRVAKLVRTFKSPTEFFSGDLNPAHILKASRGSGYTLDLAKTKAEHARTEMLRWKRELQASGKPVEFLIEEKINDAVFGVTGNAVDYKFFCFHGEPKFFLCRFAGNRNFYNLDWTPIKCGSRAALPQIDLEPMIELARRLSAPFPFVRIDLYNAVDGIYFGEYTFHVNAGKKEFSDELEAIYGSYWRAGPAET
jgi:hypothetical protein